jgi:hypothetical protein
LLITTDSQYVIMTEAENLSRLFVSAFIGDHLRLNQLQRGKSGASRDSNPQSKTCPPRL